MSVERTTWMCVYILKYTHVLGVAAKSRCLYSHTIILNIYYISQGICMSSTLAIHIYATTVSTI